MTLTTLVTGRDAASRESAIAASLDGPATTAVILEGLPSGKSPLDALAADSLQLTRIAAACPCCTGSLVFRVTLNRVLRGRPERLFVALASADHAGALRAFLAAPPYDALLQITPDLAA